MPRRLLDLRRRIDSCALRAVRQSQAGVIEVVDRVADAPPVRPLARLSGSARDHLSVTLGDPMDWVDAAYDAALGLAALQQEFLHRLAEALEPAPRIDVQEPDSLAQVLQLAHVRPH